MVTRSWWFPVPGCDSLCARLLRAHAKHQEAVFGDLPYQGSLVPLPMDVTREDVLHEAMDVIRRHLPAGHDGNVFF